MPALTVQDQNARKPHTIDSISSFIRCTSPGIVMSEAISADARYLDPEFPTPPTPLLRSQRHHPQQRTLTEKRIHSLNTESIIMLRTMILCWDGRVELVCQWRLCLFPLDVAWGCDHDRQVPGESRGIGGIQPPGWLSMQDPTHDWHLHNVCGRSAGNNAVRSIDVGPSCSHARALSRVKRTHLGSVLIESRCAYIEH